MRTIALLSFLVIGSSLVACSSSSSGGTDVSGAGGQGGSGVGQPVAQTVKAADGGMVAAAGAKALIPPGALAQDTNITVTVSPKTGQPDEADIAADVFDFGPNGTMFSKPVTLTIDFTGTAPAGKKAVIAFLKDGAWVPLADSAVAGTQVVATTTHFTPFTVVFVSGQGQTGGGCDSLAFTPCGGDLVGTWMFTAACVSLPPGTDPFNGKCPGATLAATVDFNGTITFAADKTYNLNDTTQTSLAITGPKSCFGGACPASDAKQTVTDLGDSCKLDQPQDMKASMETGTWSSSGTTFNTTKTGDTSGGTNLDYCVTGTSALVSQTDSKGNKFIYKVVKQ